MFPLRDDNPSILTPYATYGIVGLTTLAWFLLQGAGSEPLLSGSVCSLGLVPGQLLQTIPAGSRFQVSSAVDCVVRDVSAWHTVFTSIFMHGSWFHLIGNMWFLWIFGNNVEDSMGHLRFGAFYLLSGLAAAGLHIATDPSSATPMVGASGAIGGVMGAYVFLYPRVHVHMLIFLGFYITTVAVPASLMLGYWFLLQFVGGLGTLGDQGGGVAFWAHVGGFAAGAILMVIFRNPLLLREHPYHGWRRQPSPTRSWRRIQR